jgi:hypothetical protein
VTAARKASRYFRSVICLRSTRPRSQIATIYTMQSLFTPPRSVTSLAWAVSRRPPQRHPPCVFRSPTLFSACSRHTGSAPAFVWWVCRPLELFSAIAQPQHLLHYGSPFGFHFCFRSVPSGLVQRTGCSACGLGYPHQFWWAPPMYITRSWLFPVSFAGFLIKCTPRWASTAINAVE